MENLDLVPLDPSPPDPSTPKTTVKKKGFLSRRYLRSKFRVFLLICVFVGIFLVVVILLVELLGAAKGKLSRTEIYYSALSFF